MASATLSAHRIGLGSRSSLASALATLTVYPSFERRAYSTRPRTPPPTRSQPHHGMLTGYAPEGSTRGSYLDALRESGPVSNDVEDPQAAPLSGLNPGGVIYGVLAVATVIAAESTRKETFGKLLLASSITMALYWAAHAYSHHWASRFQRANTWTLSELRTSLRYEASILLGAALPLAVLALAWIAGTSTETAVTSVLWSAGIELLALEVIPGFRHRLRLRELAIQGLLGISMGVGILGLRFVLH